MKNVLTIAIFSFMLACEPVVPQNSAINKKIVFDNHVYEDIVGISRVYPIVRGAANTLENPVIALNSSNDLMLTFDLLTDKYENLSVKVFHCNRNWKKSVLRDMEFLKEINNYQITQFDYSLNTQQPYINYRIRLPKPKISGNYIVAVHRRSNPNDLILTKRIMVVENTASIDQTVRVSTLVEKREHNHQIEYEINYGNLAVNNPTTDVSTVILQNHNWNTAKTEIPPTLIKANEGIIQYKHLDATGNFPGMNDFRFIDLRNFNVAGRNVAKIINTGTEMKILAGMDPSRGKLSYTQNFQDINGNFIIQNNDPGEVLLNADYASVTFSLLSPKVEGKVYLIGRYNEWELTDTNRMRFVPDSKNPRYVTSIPLKQGYYEYLYLVVSDKTDPYFFEGSHFQAENEYEILVYYRKPGNVHDEIIGYKKFRSLESTLTR